MQLFCSYGRGSWTRLSTSANPGQDPHALFFYPRTPRCFPEPSTLLVSPAVAYANETLPTFHPMPNELHAPATTEGPESGGGAYPRGRQGPDRPSRLQAVSARGSRGARPFRPAPRKVLLMCRRRCWTLLVTTYRLLPVLPGVGDVRAETSLMRTTAVEGTVLDRSLSARRPRLLLLARFQERAPQPACIICPRSKPTPLTPCIFCRRRCIQAAERFRGRPARLRRVLVQVLPGRTRRP